MVNQKSHEGFLARKAAESEGSLLPPTRDLYPEEHRDEGPQPSSPRYVTTSLRHGFIPSPIQRRAKHR